MTGLVHVNRTLISSIWSDRPAQRSVVIGSWLLLEDAGDSSPNYLHLALRDLTQFIASF